jgi:hypothetical protein
LYFLTKKKSRTTDVQVAGFSGNIYYIKEDLITKPPVIIDMMALKETSGVVAERLKRPKNTRASPIPKAVHLIMLSSMAVLLFLF